MHSMHSLCNLQVRTVALDDQLLDAVTGADPDAPKLQVSERAGYTCVDLHGEPARQACESHSCLQLGCHELQPPST
jgi:hypothetical protein